MRFLAILLLGLAANVAAFATNLALPCLADQDPLYNSQSGLDWSYISKTPINLSFHDGLTDWYVGHDAPGYRLSYVQHGFIDGRSCALLAATNPPSNSWECIVQDICAVNCRGKRVRLSGWMKTQDAESITFGLRLDSQSNVASFSDHTVIGTTPWKKYQVVFDVPEDAQGFAVAPGDLGQRGKLWLADVRLDVVDKATPLTVQAQTDDVSGDTPRVVHTWMLSRQRKFQEALAEEEAIANDPAASKEERCTALEGISFDSMMLGQRDMALKALDQFDVDSKSLAIDPGVVAEAARTRAALTGTVASTGPTALGRWENANGNDWTDVPTTPRNLTFDSGLDGWEKGADYSDAPDYIAGCSTRACQGRPAGYVKSVVPHASDYVCLAQRVRADNYLGKRVRISAMIKSRGASATSSLFVHLDTQNHYTFWSAPDSRVTGATAWRRYDVVIDVPHDGQGIIFGGNLSGDGTLWISEVHVDIVGTQVPLSSGGTTR